MAGLQQHPLQSPSTALHTCTSPSLPAQNPTTCQSHLWLLPAQTLHQLFLGMGVFSPCQSLLSHLKHFAILQTLQIENIRPQDSCAPSHSGGSHSIDSSHGSTLLCLLRADLYLSNTCKLSAIANRPSLLILTSEGALLYFSVNSPTSSLPSPPALSVFLVQTHMLPINMPPACNTRATHLKWFGLSILPCHLSSFPPVQAQPVMVGE